MRACLLLPLLAACSHVTPAPPAAPAGALPVDAVLQQAQTLKQQTIRVSGRYAGWQGRCSSGPPISRSDWMVHGETGCIYAHGHLPAGFSLPPQPADIGRPIEVRARLQFDHRGQPYLDVVQ